MKNKKQLITIITILSFLLSLSFGFNLYSFTENKDTSIIDQVINEGNVTYKVTLENYYDVEYKNNGNGLELKINNPCIEVLEAEGLSMKPYWDNHTLNIFDTCFPKEDLKEGDIIVFWEDDYRNRIYHRIIEIDYEKEWVRTKGDNPITNSKPDDFTSFDKIYAKGIGFLNVLEQKKIVNKEIVNITIGSLFLNSSSYTNDYLVIDSFFSDYSPSFKYNIFCVCSSLGVLRICHENITSLYKDSFVRNNDLREEYCQEDN